MFVWPCPGLISAVSLIVLLCKGLSTVCAYRGVSASSSDLTMGHKGPRGRVG